MNLRLRWWPHLRRIAWNALALFGIYSAIRISCFDLHRVASSSMAPTLYGANRREGDLVFSEKVSLALRAPRRWEVIAFYDSYENLIIKRVVGLPGEKVQLLENGDLVVDGRPQPRPASLEAIAYKRYGNLMSGKIADCGDGYFVLGDDSRDSDDSRFNGPVASENIVARPLLILAPADRRGWVQP
jgi:signal peptidase I